MRFILSTILLAVVLTLQAKHLEIMGIPIDGSISTFQTKLQNKGCTISQYNKTMPSGIRLFDGIFTGKESLISVNYTPKTGQVYQVKVIIPRTYKRTCKTYDEALKIFNELVDLLERKYKNISQTSEPVAETEAAVDEPALETEAIEVVGDESPLPYKTYYIFNDNPEPGDLAIGAIEIQIEYIYIHGIKNYYITLFYTDTENYKLDDAAKMSDL